MCIRETGLNLFVHNNIVPQLLNFAHLSLTRETLFLDVGCGKGNLCKSLVSNRKRIVIGIDLCKRSISEAKETGSSNVDYLLSDSTHLPFRNDVFDYIFVVGVLHHIPNFTQAISEISRALKNKGYFIGTEPNKFHPHFTVLISNLRIQQLFPFVQKEEPINPRKLVKILEAEGFKIIYEDFRLGLKFLVTPFELILKPELSLRIYNLLSKLDFLVPSILRNCFIFYAKKSALLH